MHQMFWMGACEIFCYIHYGEGTQVVSDSSFFPKTISAWNRLAFGEALSLAVFRSNCLNN